MDVQFGEYDLEQEVVMVVRARVPLVCAYHREGRCLAPVQRRGRIGIGALCRARRLAPMASVVGRSARPWTFTCRDCARAGRW